MCSANKCIGVKLNLIVIILETRLNDNIVKGPRICNKTQTERHRLKDIDMENISNNKRVPVKLRAF